MIDTKKSLLEDTLVKEVSVTLGLQEAVSPAVLHKIANDPVFAHNLMVSRSSKDLLNVLLASAEAQEVTSDIGLVKEAASSFLKWARSGFSNVDEETLNGRLKACYECPYIIDAPNRSIYKVLQQQSEKICSACGCIVNWKAKLSTEACPKESPDIPGQNRWGQRFIKK